jgi:hypothetical protein
MELTADAAEFHGKVRAALEKAIGERQLELVKPWAGARCASPACLKDVAADSGATEVLAVTGGQSDYRGYKLEVELWHAATGASEYGSAECNFCNASQMVVAAEKQAGPMLDHLATAGTPPVPPSQVATSSAPGSAPLSTAPPAASLVSAPPAERPIGRLVLGGSLTAVGVAAAAVGAVFLYQDGRHTDCQTVCRSVYDGRGFGIPLVIGGLALGGVGGWLMYTARGTTVALGPRGMSIAGAF